MEDDIRAMGEGLGPLPLWFVNGFLDAVPTPAAIVDGSGVVVAVNSAWRDFALANGAGGQTWNGQSYLRIAESSDDEDAMAVAGGLRAVLSGTRHNFDHVYPCHGNGQERWFRCLIAPLQSSPGDPSGASILHLDVTTEKLAEAKALAASRAKSEFLAQMSHELRTPLNAVIGFAELLNLETWGPLGDSRYRDYAADIMNAGKHLLALINEVLDLSKVEAGKYQLNEEAFDLPHMLAHACHLVAERAARGGISVKCLPAQDLGEVWADPRLICQILLNLLSNAIKFTPHGGEAQVEAKLREDGWVVISVADNGIGISAKDIAVVMEPFGQVDSSLARKNKGESTGLGLPLCNSFVELHGGSLIMQSQPGQGTVVTVLLPPERRRF